MILSSSPPHPLPPTAVSPVLSVLGSLLQVVSWQSISSVPTSPPHHPQGLRLVPRAAAGTGVLLRDVTSGKVMPGATKKSQMSPWSPEPAQNLHGVHGLFPQEGFMAPVPRPLSESCLCLQPWGRAVGAR